MASKVLIAVPCLDYVSADFAFSLAALLNRRAYDSKLRKEVEVSLVSQKGSIIMDARNALAKAALASNSSHILFWDSDITLPMDALDILLSHHKDIVCATYVQRSEGHMVLGQRDMAQPTVGPLAKMLTIPLGACLIRTSVFQRLPFPWFAYPWNPTEGRFYSEDTYFCTLAHSASPPIPIYCDLTLSPKVRHVGSAAYSAPERLEVSLNKDAKL